MFSFLKKPIQDKSFAVFCIDGAAVTLTILKKKIDSTELILHVSRVSLDLNSIKDADKLIRDLKSALDKVFDGFKKNRLYDLVTPDIEIVVFVGSPWHIGWSNTVKVEKEKLFKVTESLINDSIKSSFESVHPDLNITNVNIMSRKLNGYEMKDPISRSTKSLELKVYVSSAPKSFIDLVEKSIQSNFLHKKITFCSYNIGIYNSIYNTLAKTDCLLVIPEIETTSLILIKSGSVEAEASIPFGATMFAQSLFGAKSSSIKESLLKTKRFVEGTLDVPEIESIKTKVATIKSTFLDQFREVVWKMNDTLVLPNDMFVVGRNLATHFVFEWLNSDEYIKNTFTVDEFKITNIRGSDIISNPKFNGMFHHKSVPLSVAVSTQYTFNERKIS